MSQTLIGELIDKYITLTFCVHKNAESLIQSEMGSELTTDQHYVLRYINKVGSCTTTELARVFDVKKSAITAIIQRMWQKGLVQRTRDSKDRRFVYLTLTKEGKDVFHESEERIYRLVESLMQKFELEEINQFISTYEKLNDVLVEFRNKGLRKS